MSDIWEFAGENTASCPTEFTLTVKTGDAKSFVLAPDYPDTADYGSTLEGTTLTIDPSEMDPSTPSLVVITYKTSDS